MRYNYGTDRTGYRTGYPNRNKECAAEEQLQRRKQARLALSPSMGRRKAALDAEPGVVGLYHLLVGVTRYHAVGDNHYIKP